MHNAKRKVDAIYELRAAAEEKGRAEQALDVEKTPRNFVALRKAQMEVEQKTVIALDACDQCHRPHLPGEPHVRE